MPADHAHIRLPDNAATYCGTAGESMSLAFWFAHVMPNRDGCCQQLYRRLCPACDKLMPFTLQSAGLVDEEAEDEYRDEGTTRATRTPRGARAAT